MCIRDRFQTFDTKSLSNVDLGLAKYQEKHTIELNPKELVYFILGVIKALEIS